MTPTSPLPFVVRAKRGSLRRRRAIRRLGGLGPAVRSDTPG